MNYISRHRSESAAIKRAHREAKKAKRSVFISSDQKWFYVTVNANSNNDTEVAYVVPVNTRCQHCDSDTGSSRASNCSLCSELKNDVHRERIAYVRYRDLINLFEKHSHLREEAFHKAIQESMKSLIEKARQKEKDEVERKRRSEEEYQENKTLLKSAGYRWQKVPVGTEEDWAPGGYGAGIGEFSHWRWELYDSNDNRVNYGNAIRKLRKGKLNESVYSSSSQK